MQNQCISFQLCIIINVSVISQGSAATKYLMRTALEISSSFTRLRIWQIGSDLTKLGWRQKRDQFSLFGPLCIYHHSLVQYVYSYQPQLFYGMTVGGLCANDTAITL